MYIAVYGHPSHEVTHYTLDVVYEPSSPDPFSEEADSNNIDKEKDNRQGFTKDKNYQGRQVNTDNTDKEKDNRQGFTEDNNSQGRQVNTSYQVGISYFYWLL